MIDEDRTLQLFGYTSDDLSAGSHKPVARVCEGCGRYGVVEYKARTELCLSCVRKYQMLGEKNHQFGKHPSKKTREKMSEARKGDKNHNFGKHLPDKTLKKISIANMGRIVSRNTRLKQSKARQGIANPNWKGGITGWRTKLWNSLPYQAWRKAIFKRDNYTCQMCTEQGGKLQAHHIKPVREHKNDLLMFDINNGITLCNNCHKQTFYHESDFETFFDIIIENKEVILNADTI